MTEQKKQFELTAQEFVEKLQEEEPQDGERVPDGMITDRDEVTKFMEWLTDPARKNK